MASSAVDRGTNLMWWLRLMVDFGKVTPLGLKGKQLAQQLTSCFELSFPEEIYIVVREDDSPVLLFFTR